LDEIRRIFIKEMSWIEEGCGFVVGWHAQVKVGRRGDDVVGLRVDLKSVDLRDDWVDFAREDPWGWYDFVGSWGYLFFDQEWTRPVVMKFARKVFGGPWREKIDLVPWAERAKSTCIVLPTTVDSVLEICSREEVRSLFLTRPDQEISAAVALKFALSVVEASEEQVEAGSGVSTEDNLEWRGAPSSTDGSAHGEEYCR